ncbi:MTR3 [Candida pseudojiufengensis]|uniref:MTR3 n=1 Tax=Candida pseudojiufengensis TaxID=497109 RepID=UPI002224FDCC|nr:MTR3 [Candida pseudojiufengensis]KAI5966838.1 MTR3 [Candida pseudojiufengensis]
MSDRRRILGPSNTIIPNVPQNTESSSSQPNNSNELPKFFLKNSLIKNSNGSSYLEIGSTIIEVSIFGPRPIRGSFLDKASISIETKFLNNVPQPLSEIFNFSGGGGINEKPTIGMSIIEHKISSFIENCILSTILLKNYPKSTIDFQISIISIDSNVKGISGLLWLINWILICTSLAIIDTGIEIKDIISSSIIKLNSKGEVLKGENILSDNNDGILALISFLNLKNNEIIGCWFENNNLDINEKNMELLIDECCKNSKIIRSNLNSYLINSYDNE